MSVTESASSEVIKSPIAVVNATVVKVGCEDFIKLLELFRPRGATVIKGRVKGMLGKGKDVLVLIHGSIAYVCVIEKGEELVVTPDIEVEDLRFSGALVAVASSL